MTIFGWDASDYDFNRGPMDLVAARNAGVAYFTYKATESTNVKHVHYGEALNRAKAAGIEYLGAYIVPRSGVSIDAQVNYFMDYVNSQTPWWTSFPGFFFQVDTEKWSYDQVSPAIGAQVCTALRNRTGRQVIHYAPQWAYGNTIPGSDPLWASSYGNNAIGTLAQEYPGDSSSRWVAYSGRTPVFLQFGSQIVIGSQHTCDGNAFRGSVNDLHMLITGTSGGGSTSGGLDMLEECSRSSAVSHATWKLQNVLVTLGYNTNGVDGIYLDGTAGAVRQVCADTGLHGGDTSGNSFGPAEYTAILARFAQKFGSSTGAGVPGPEGPQGPAGPEGPQGPKGDAAVLAPGATLLVQ